MKLQGKYLIVILMLLLFVSAPVSAKEDKPIATVEHQISSDDMPNGISFKANTELILSDGKITIPKNATVYAVIVDTQGERRWHKSGFIVCRLKGYEVSKYIDSESEDKNYVDIEKENIYMIARKYVPIDKKEVAKTAVEVSATTAASFVVPGIDIAYYFTKGMIKKKEDQTRLKSGVTTAYENSIFWFWLKGKPIDLEEDAKIKFKEISQDEAQKISKQIVRRTERGERMQERKEAFKEFMSY